MVAKIADLLGLVVREEWALGKFFEYLGKVFSAGIAGPGRRCGQRNRD